MSNEPTVSLSSYNNLKGRIRRLTGALRGVVRDKRHYRDECHRLQDRCLALEEAAKELNKHLYGEIR